MSRHHESSIRLIAGLIEMSEIKPRWNRYASDDFSTVRWDNPSMAMIEYVLSNGIGLHLSVSYSVDESDITIFTTLDAEERCEGEK